MFCGNRKLPITMIRFWSKTVLECVQPQPNIIGGPDLVLASCNYYTTLSTESDNLVVMMLLC